MSGENSAGESQQHVIVRQQFNQKGGFKPDSEDESSDEEQIRPHTENLGYDSMNACGDNINHT